MLSRRKFLIGASSVVVAAATMPATSNPMRVAWDLARPGADRDAFYVMYMDTSTYRAIIHDMEEFRKLHEGDVRSVGGCEVREVKGITFIDDSEVH